MKGLVAGLILLGTASAFAQTPDPHDSVIIESKLISPNLNGNPAFLLAVYITNKDTLANLTLPLELKTTSGTAFILLNSPRTFAGTINRLTSTLGNNPVCSPFVNDASPDSAVWSGFWDPTDTTTAEPPNSSRKAFWEIKFKHSSDSLGTVKVDSADIFANRVGFVGLGGNSIGVNFVRGFVNVNQQGPCSPNCALAGGNVLYGRPYSFTFWNWRSGTWSMVSGPGVIDPITGTYSFSGQCALGAVPVVVRHIDVVGDTCDCAFGLYIVDNAPTSSPAQNTITVSHGQTASNRINASDWDAGDGFIFSKLDGPGYVDSTGVWKYPTTCADVGLSPQTVQIQTSDAYRSCRPGPLSSTCSFQLVVTNAAPAITNCPSVTIPIDTGSTFSFQVAATDPDPADSGHLSYLLVSAPAGLSLSSAGLVQWKPSGSQWGLRSATIQVRDGCGAFANCQFNFAVSISKGDMNGDGRLSPADLVYLFNCIFLGTPPPVGSGSCDLNCDGASSAVDGVLLLYAVFFGSPFPC